MGEKSRYQVPMATLDGVQVPVGEQVEEQDVPSGGEYLSPEEQDRARVLSPTHAGRLRLE